MPAFAITPEEILVDPALEARARALGEELRCLVCDNETIAASNAPLAGDLRKLVREKIVAGNTDEEIRDMLVERYGEFVLFRPRLGGRNLILWFVPFAIFVGAGVYLIARARRPTNRNAPSALSEDEENELAQLIEPASAPSSDK